MCVTNKTGKLISKYGYKPILLSLENWERLDSSEIKSDPNPIERGFFLNGSKVFIVSWRRTQKNEKTREKYNDATPFRIFVSYFPCFPFFCLFFVIQLSFGNSTSCKVVLYNTKQTLTTLDYSWLSLYKFFDWKFCFRFFLSIISLLRLHLSNFCLICICFYIVCNGYLVILNTAWRVVPNDKQG